MAKCLSTPLDVRDDPMRSNLSLHETLQGSTRTKSLEANQQQQATKLHGSEKVSYFTKVPPCLLFLAPLSSPLWGQPGHTVRLVSPPSLRSLHLSFPLLLPLNWFITVTSCLTCLLWQAWKTWENTKKEIEAKATKAGVIWFVDEDAVVQHILEIISRDEIAMDVTYQEAREHDNLKKAELQKDEEEMAHYHKH